MAGFAPVSEQTQTSQTSVDNNNNYLVPLIVLTSLFFMWGFITCLNDILVPHLKIAFQLQNWQSSLIQTFFFFAYFVVALIYFVTSQVYGDLLNKIGYKNGIILGLLILAFGCALFYPAAEIKQYWFFLVALFVLGAGVTILQIAANPYVSILGKAESASSRLTMTQAFNSLGTTLAPYFGILLILTSKHPSPEQLNEFTPNELSSYLTNEAKSVQLPYIGLAITLLALSGLIYLFKLPKITGGNASEISKNIEKFTFNLIWTKYRHLLFGMGAIFMYVGGEVAIGTFIINFIGQSNIKGFLEPEAAKFLPLYWGGAMVGRFLGAVILYYFKPSKILAFCATMVCTLLIVGINTEGDFAMWSILSIGLFNSIMFPTIFALSIEGLGDYTSKASSMLVMMIVGGAVIPPIMGLFADTIGYQKSFFVPFICYTYILFFAIKGYQNITKSIKA